MAKVDNSLAFCGCLVLIEGLGLQGRLLIVKVGLSDNYYST